ncbi:MAG: DUF2892 domain-containing protein [Actinobacteria bacterium]|nr:DUF2892 domain-containing protein [Actinomycetota bacterium]
MNCCAQHTSTTEPTERPRKHSRTNITTVERAGRITVGILAGAFGVAGLAGAGSALVLVLYLLLIAAGIDLIVTGATGHCPLYQRLGFTPRSLRSEP